MNITYDEKKRLLCIGFQGEIDHHSCPEIVQKADDAIHKYLPNTVVFDFEDVSFMDSSGIGMLLGRYKKISRYGAIAFMKHVHGDIDRIFQMSGIYKIIPTTKEEYIYG